MMSRLKYYLFSLPTLLFGIKNWYRLPFLLFQKEPIVLELRNGCRFCVRSLMDAWIVKETCLDRGYETASVPLQDGWTIIDVGAGIGDFAVFAAYRHSRSSVYAYEPFPQSFALLEENIRLNSVQNIVPVAAAVAVDAGIMTLYTTGAAVQHTTIANADRNVAPAVVEVQAVSLDELFEKNGISHCHFLKIDCEGCEFDILLNADQALLKKIDHICLEYHDGFTVHTHTDLTAHLQQNGFQVRVTPNPAHGYLGLLYASRQRPFFPNSPHS
jgi:FkbM family methyltransferase